MTQVPIPGTGIALASNSNKNPNAGFYDQYSRPKELVEKGIQWMIHKYIEPLIDDGVQSVILDMPGGKKNIVGKYSYRDWEQRSKWPFTKGRREIKKMELAIKGLASMQGVEEVLLYLGCLEEPEMKALRGWFFIRAANKPISPFMHNEKVSYVFDATNSTEIAIYKHPVNKFLGRLGWIIGEDRIYREALPRNYTQYDQQAFIKINAHRQFTNLSPEVLIEPIHFYYDDRRLVGTIPIPGKEGTEYASLAWWGYYCFDNGYKFSVAEHVMRSLGMTYPELRDEIQAIVDKEMK